MTGKVAPHEGREIELVLAGVKPLATIELAKDPNQYYEANDLHVAGWLFTRTYTDGPLAGLRVFTQPERSYLIDIYENLVRDGDLHIGREEYQRRMGRLFGYSEEDINEFINGGFVCDCIQCVGMSRGVQP